MKLFSSFVIALSIDTVALMCLTPLSSVEQFIIGFSLDIVSYMCLTPKSSMEQFVVAVEEFFLERVLSRDI